ncbi:MAG: glutamine-hydrolyzing GMP synthase [Oligoflexia bacterium]|nr:glutamine-hydrolyzing GMP synthase [Oligoflexia bacterium]
MRGSKNAIAILDFGSQFTQLIARRVRELSVYSEIFPHDMSLDEIIKMQPAGIILSGGPSSIYEKDAQKRNDLKEIVNKFPVLGICYGMQILTQEFGGKVQPGKQREYGANFIKWSDGKKQKVWMSHGDYVSEVPNGTKITARSENEMIAAIENFNIGKGFMALQFHPEVTHTENGTEILKDFLFNKAKCEANWSGKKLVEHLCDEIKNKVGATGKVLCALSGGVDSTVTASLLVKALGAQRVWCVFVDTGLMRKNESDEVLEAYAEMGLKVKAVFAEEKFLNALKGKTDPEEKRKIIGGLFIDIFDEATKSNPCDFLAQGTLYPDVIESVSVKGKSVTIKSHHNVGGLPERMKLKLVEPLRELFKDEVRKLGRELKVPENLLMRHPFPGPGLGIRIIGEINKEDLDILKNADDIYISELKKENLYSKIWQAFTVLLPVKTVGVMGDGRTYERVAALRAVTSHDGMTADWYQFDPVFLAKVSNRITNEVKGINRVVYDISSKPPATIEWE